jgi:uncharacterized protein (DUF983 family)
LEVLMMMATAGLLVWVQVLVWCEAVIVTVLELVQAVQ